MLVNCTEKQQYYQTDTLFTVTNCVLNYQQFHYPEKRWHDSWTIWTRLILCIWLHTSVYSINLDLVVNPNPKWQFVCLWPRLNITLEARKWERFAGSGSCDITKGQHSHSETDNETDRARDWMRERKTEQQMEQERQTKWERKTEGEKETDRQSDPITAQWSVASLVTTRSGLRSQHVLMAKCALFLLRWTNGIWKVDAWSSRQLCWVNGVAVTLLKKVPLGLALLVLICCRHGRAFCWTMKPWNWTMSLTFNFFKPFLGLRIEKKYRITPLVQM